MSVGPRKGWSGWGLSGWRLSVGSTGDWRLRVQRQEVGRRKGRRKKAWSWNNGNRSDWRESAVVHEFFKRCCVAPHASQTIRNAIWHGAVFPVPQAQLRQPHACQHHDGVFAKAHIPPPHSPPLKPAKKAHVGVTRVVPLAGCLLNTFPFANRTWAPPHAVSSAVPPRMGTTFAVAATRGRPGLGTSWAAIHPRVRTGRTVSLCRSWDSR